MSYLREVKDKLEESFIDCFERSWKEIVEPALKESYKNGLEAGRKGEVPATDAKSDPQRKTWSRNRERRT